VFTQNDSPFCEFSDIMSLPGNHYKIPQKGSNEGYQRKTPQWQLVGQDRRILSVMLKREV